MTNPALITHYEARIDHLVQQAESQRAAGLSDDLHVTNSALRRARMSLARARGSHTEAQWLALVAECNRDCVRCGQHHHEPVMPLKAHIVPVALGGSNDISNIMPVCRTCSSARQAEGIDWLAAYRETNSGRVPEGA